jgi:hypothetical protein
VVTRSCYEAAVFTGSSQARTLRPGFARHTAGLQIPQPSWLHLGFMLALSLLHVPLSSLIFPHPC